MGLRINTNIAALNAARTLQKSTIALNKSLERLSSGLRINRARDDAAGLAIAENFNSVVRGSAVAQRNAQDGINMVQTAEGGLATSASILQRIRELAVQAANGTNSTDNYTAINTEVQQLLGQVNDIAFNTEYNGKRVLSATALISLQTGAQSGQVTLVNLSLANTTQLKVNLVSTTNQAAATAAIIQIDSAITVVNGLRATLGAQQNRLEFTIETLGIQEENSAASESAIRDADIARETIGFTRNQILITAGTAVLAQANIVPQTALTLLG